MIRIAVLASGNGSNLQAIIDACASCTLNAKLACVISNKADAHALTRAHRANIPTSIVDYKLGIEKAEKSILTTLSFHQVHIVVLAGYMRILSPMIINALCRSYVPVINLHPAFPGQFPGINAIDRAYEAWTKGEITHTGIMVHYVAEEIDAGTVIVYEKIPFIQGENVHGFTLRLQDKEKPLLISAIDMVINTKVSADYGSLMSIRVIGDSPLELLYRGKVRNIYTGVSYSHPYLVLEQTDRQSAFDRNLCMIPNKGRLLTDVSAWWFNRISEDLNSVKTHYISHNDKYMRVKKCEVIPIEFVVRGYITGNTKTSLWTHYNAGERTYCGIEFPEGLVKNQMLEHPVITPTTKGEIVDVPISADEIVEQRIISHEEWNHITDIVEKLFEYGQKVAQQQGLILVDTKYEFGYDENRDILLIDEVHTCDSSRYWISETYQERFEQGLEPEKLDKDIIRDWVKSTYPDPYKTPHLHIPSKLIQQASEGYANFFQMLTSSKTSRKIFE